MELKQIITPNSSLFGIYYDIEEDDLLILPVICIEVYTGSTGNNYVPKVFNINSLLVDYNFGEKKGIKFLGWVKSDRNYHQRGFWEEEIKKAIKEYENRDKAKLLTWEENAKHTTK